MDFFREHILSHYNYWVSIILMMVGFYIVIQSGNLVKKLIGIVIFQTSVLLFYISAGNVKGAKVPILEEGNSFYVNPLPHVLMLTAIVVGVATLAVGLAIVVRIREAYGSIEEDDILEEDAQTVAKLYEVSKKKVKHAGIRGNKSPEDHTAKRTSSAAFPTKKQELSPKKKHNAMPASKSSSRKKKT